VKNLLDISDDPLPAIAEFETLRVGCRFANYIAELVAKSLGDIALQQRDYVLLL
jgi:hypothetical protein